MERVVGLVRRRERRIRITFSWAKQWEGTLEVVSHNQELALLTEAIQSLPDRCRQIFTLRKVSGLSQAEIAAQLGVSENTVSAQLTISVKKCMAFMLPCRRRSRTESGFGVWGSRSAAELRWT